MDTTTSPAPATPRTGQATGTAQVLGVVAAAAALCYAGLAAWCWIAEATYDGDSLGVGYLLAGIFGAFAAFAGVGGTLSLILARRCPRTAATFAVVGLGVAILPVLFFAMPLPFW